MTVQQELGPGTAAEAWLLDQEGPWREVGACIRNYLFYKGYVDLDTLFNYVGSEVSEGNLNIVPASPETVLRSAVEALQSRGDIAFHATDEGEWDVSLTRTFVD